MDFLSEGDKCNLINNVSYGFIKNRSVKKAAKNACKLRNKHPWAYKTDITQFFDSISRDTLKNTIKKAIPQRSLHHLLLSAIDCEIHETNKDRIKKYTKQASIKE